MANRKSVAAQAIKDMLELGIDVTLLIGHIEEIHVMNAEIGIVTKTKSKKVKKAPKINSVTVKTFTAPKHMYNRTIIINVDGTVSVEFTEWDYK